MNRIDAIQWCKDYLPEWPGLYNDLKKLARPLGWKWELKRLPYRIEAELVLINGTRNFVNKDQVWPPALAPALAPAPAPWPEHVREFLETIKNSNVGNGSKSYLLMTKDEFEKIAADYPPFNLVINNQRSGAIFKKVIIKVVNQDVQLIGNFLSEYQNCFKDFILSNNRSLSKIHDIFETLIYEK